MATPMTPLADLFEQKLPAALAPVSRIKNGRAPCIGFAATSGAETGFWVLSLKDLTCRRATAADKPDVIVSADVSVFPVLFAGNLNVKNAVLSGDLVLQGDLSAFDALARMLSGA